MYNKDVFVVNRWILRLAGLWAPSNPSKIVQTLYRLYAIFLFLFVDVYFTATEFYSLFYTYKNLGFFIKNMNFFLTHVMGVIKVTFWYFKSNVLIHFMEILESTEFQYESFQSYQPKDIWLRYRKTGFKYSLGFLMLAHMTLSSGYLPPMLTVIFHPPSYKNETSDFYYRLPYFSWMPFKHLTPGMYLIALGFQAGAMFSYAYSIVGMDTLFMNIMNFIAAHLTILQGAFETCRERVIATNCLDVNTKMNKEMKKHCRHLQILLRVSEDLENVHRYITLAQSTATLFILCTCIFLTTTSQIGSKIFFSEIIYMVAMGFQLYLYCWFGNEITLKASEIPLYIWKAQWFDSESSFKKNMIFTMTRMQKPIYMTVGKFAPLTLQTFVYIIRTSYSIFAVIKNTSLGE